MNLRKRQKVRTPANMHRFYIVIMSLLARMMSFDRF